MTKRQDVRLGLDTRGYYFAWWYDRNGKRKKEGIGPKRDWSKKDAQAQCDEIAKKLFRDPTKRSGTKGITLSQFQGVYFSNRPDMGVRTKQLYEQTFKRLLDHFGDIPIRRIDRGEAKKFEAALKKTLGIPTVRLHIRNAKALFGASENGAVGLEYLDASPFIAIKSGSVAGDKGYLSEADAEKVREELSPAHRVPFVLARYCGLRILSEGPLLTWDRVDFGKRRMLVIDKKRSRVEDDRPEMRVRERHVLIDARAEADLLAAWELRERDDGPVVTVSLDPKLFHRAIQRAAKRAQVKVWPKTLQTLRQSCENDWRPLYPDHVVEEWMGHSDGVGRKHYASVDDRWYESQPIRRENGAKTDAQEKSTESPESQTTVS